MLGNILCENVSIIFSYYLWYIFSNIFCIEHVCSYMPIQSIWLQFLSFFRPVETGGTGGPANPQIFAKFDILLIDNDCEKKKIAKEKYKLVQILRKVLATLLLHRELTYEIFKKGRLGRTSTLKWGLLEKRGNFFQRGVAIWKKNKLKSEIFNDKKSL